MMMIGDNLVGTAERVMSLLKDHKTKTKKDLVEKYERLFFISRATVYKRFEGKHAFTFDEIEMICNKYNVSADWLMFGIGEKYRK